MNFDQIAQSALDAPFRAQQKRTELAAFLEFLAPRKLQNILEIGVLKGGTIKAWTEIADLEAQIIGVDLPGGTYGGGFEPQEEASIEKLAKAMQVIRLFPLDSHDPETFNRIQSYGMFDLIFIDGDHSYEGVKQDFEMYSPLTKRGGVIAFHDVAEHTNYKDVGVHILWKELKEKFPAEKVHEFIDLDYPTDHGIWGGIGAIEL